MDVRYGEGALGKGGDAGVGAELLEALVDGLGDVGAGFEVDFLEGLGIEGAVDLDCGAALDEGLDLSFVLLPNLAVHHRPFPVFSSGFGSLV